MTHAYLPPDLLIIWRGQPNIARKYDDADEYSMQCPQCGTRQSFDVEGPRQRGYVVSYGSEGVSLSPSLVCANECGWHVVVENGVARDV